jgi:hypothetical protein
MTIDKSRIIGGIRDRVDGQIDRPRQALARGRVSHRVGETVAAAVVHGLAVSAASGNEDTAIALSISAAQTDADASEVLTVKIEGIPTGATLTNTAGDTLTITGGSITLTPAQLTGLAITPPANSDADFNLTVTAISKDGSATAATTVGTIAVTVNAVADLTAGNDSATTDEGVAIINGSVAGNDSTTSGGSLSFAKATDPSHGTVTVMIATPSSVVALSLPAVSSATAFTVTAIVPTVVAAVAQPSFEMAVTVRLKSASLLAGGVIARPVSCAGVSVMLPPVMVSVSPAVLVSVAPVGMPSILTVSTSLASASVCAALIDSAIAVSSLPLAADTARPWTTAAATVSPTR